MKRSAIFLSSLLLCFLSCQEAPKENKPDPSPPLSILEKIANAHGFEHFKNIEEITFTFNVDRDGSHFQRPWTWHTVTQDVQTLHDGKKFTYNRNQLDSVASQLNAGFTNDKYWLLAPFNLVWDQDNFTYTHQEEALAPISKKSMQQLTIVYGDTGGYTPGDAYDFFFGPDLIIREWIYRKGNQQDPSLITTWEDYATLQGLKISQTHQNGEGTFKLYFTDLQVVPKTP